MSGIRDQKPQQEREMRSQFDSASNPDYVNQVGLRSRPDYRGQLDSGSRVCSPQFFADYRNQVDYGSQG